MAAFGPKDVNLRGHIPGEGGGGRLGPLHTCLSRGDWGGVRNPKVCAPNVAQSIVRLGHFIFLAMKSGSKGGVQGRGGGDTRPLSTVATPSNTPLGPWSTPTDPHPTPKGGEGGVWRGGGRGVWLRPPSSQGPPTVPAEGAPKF